MISVFNSSNLFVGERGELLLPPAAGKFSTILIKEPEQQVRQTIRHIDDQAQV